jgi:hypothetical protein
MPQDESALSRRAALRCLAFGAAGTLFTLSGGVLVPEAVTAAELRMGEKQSHGKPLFVQLSDTHIGFHKDANPDVVATLNSSIDLINSLPHRPAFALHTGDITHLSKPAEFDTAAQLLARLSVSELHTVPGEHDVADAEVKEYFARFGAASKNRGYYAFDHSGVHFIALINVLQAKDGGAGYLGEEPAGLGARGSSRSHLEHAYRGFCPHAAVECLRTLGLAHERLRCAVRRTSPLRIGDRAERAHSPDRPEGRRKHHLSYRTLDGVPAAGAR